MYSAGLARAGDALDLADVDFEQETVHVHGKGGKERVVPLGEEASHWLGRYLREARPGAVRGAEAAVFVSARGRRLDTSTLRRICPNPHKLRHAFATHLLEAGPTCGRSRSCSATRPSRRRRSTATSTESATRRVYDRAHPRS